MKVSNPITLSGISSTMKNLLWKVNSLLSVLVSWTLALNQEAIWITLDSLSSWLFSQSQYLCSFVSWWVFVFTVDKRWKRNWFNTRIKWFGMVLLGSLQSPISIYVYVGQLITIWNWPLVLLKKMKIKMRSRMELHF